MYRILVRATVVYCRWVFFFFGVTEGNDHVCVYKVVVMTKTLRLDTNYFLYYYCFNSAEIAITCHLTCGQFLGLIRINI